MVQDTNVACSLISDYENADETFPVKIISYEEKHRMAVTILSQIEPSRGYGNTK